MAKQVGFGMIIGTIGDLTFYESNGAYYVRRKTDVGAQRVQEAPEFELTRQNNAEFALAMRHGWGIRTALRQLVYGIMDKGNSGRLGSKLYQNIQRNPVGERGKRKLYTSELDMWLEGHEFNNRSTLAGNFDLFDNGGVQVSINRSTGMHSVTFAAHGSGMDILAPGVASHYSFVAGIAAWDGTEEDVQGQWRCGWRGKWTESTKYEVGGVNVPETKLDIEMVDSMDQLLLVVAGMRYWHKVADQLERAGDGRFDCLRIIKIENP